MQAARFVDWMGVQQRAVFRGESPCVQGGFELLSTKASILKTATFSTSTPSSSPSMDAAKTHAASTLKTRESDWVAHEGEPEWAAAFRFAADGVISKSLGDVVAE